MGTKTDAFVKLALVFFISLLSFSIGTYVGKKYSDNQYQMASLEPQKTHGGHGESERTVASVEDHSTSHEESHATTPKSEKVSDEEIAKLAEEFVNDEPAKTAEHGALVEGKSTEHKEVAEDSVESTTTHEKPSAAAQALVHNKNPLVNEKKDEKRIPTSLPKEYAQSPVGKFTVQIASFADEVEAQKSAENYKRKGYSAFYIPATLKGKTWFRVSVGQFATQDEAIKYKNKFLSETNLSSAIVQKMTQ